MAVLTANQITQLNNMCGVATGVLLGTRLQYIDSDGSFNGPITMDTVVTDRLTSVTTGAFGAAAGATGVALAGVDPDQVLQAHGYISAAATAGAYAGTYTTLTAVATQTADVSLFGMWAELYLTGAITLKSNHAAVWGNLEMADGGGAITLPGGFGWHAGVIGTVIAPDGLVVSSGGQLAGLMARSHLTAGLTTTGAIVAGVIVNKDASSLAWPVGLYIGSGATAIPIQVGEWSSATASVGHVLLTANQDGSGCASALRLSCDDGGAALTGIAAPIMSRYLLTVNQSGGATQAGAYIQLKTYGTRTFTNGGFRGAYIFNQAGTITLAGSAEYVIANMACTLAGTMTVGSGTMFAGLDVNIGGAGTVSNSGTSAGIIIRNTSGATAVWPIGLYIDPTGSTQCIKVGAESASASGSGVPVSATAASGLHYGAEFYFDDGGAALTAGWVEAFRVGYLVSAVPTAHADIGLSAFHAYTYLAQTTDTDGGFSGIWGSLMVKAGKTIEIHAGSGDFAGGHFGIDVPNTAVIAANTFACGISIGGNLGGTHTGNAVAFRVRSPSAGEWDALCDIPAHIVGGSNGGGADTYIDIFIAGVAARITAKYV